MESTNQKGKQEEEKMTTIILFWYLTCQGGICEAAPFEVTPHAAAIIACESGDTINLGTYTLSAKNPNSSASGLFQFINSTYRGLTGREDARYDTAQNQYKAFKKLWNNGAGWKHWRASQSCWSQWMTINDEDVAVWR
jgi:hypothetical protein